MLQEALTKYNEIINIYYHQQKYTAAIKMYKMALDILPSTSK